MPDTVVFDFDDQPRIGDAAAQVNAASLDFRSQAMLNGVLDQRLQQHAGNHDIERCRIKFLDHTQFVPPESDNFDVEIVVDKFELFPQGRKRFAAIKQPPQNRRQLEDHVARRVGIKAHQRRNRIQSIEQEVRIDLILQRLHAGVQQQALLLLEFDLNAYAVEDLEFDSDRRDRSRHRSAPRPRDYRDSRC